MDHTDSQPERPSARIRPSRIGRLFRRAIAWVSAGITDARTMRAAAAGFVFVHVVVWTAILCLLKTAQDLHFDTTEAYAWGREFLLGYGKHPPLSGWIAGLWFRFAPTTDASAYALAMATTGFGLFVCWLIACRVVDRRRAFLGIVLLALYPIFNFKGFKYNADLAQVAVLPLIVLAYLNAFEKRDRRSGIWLGLAAAAGVLTKYWALTLIGAIGLTALLHPQRAALLRSPAPWVAMAVFAVAVTPHLVWLWQVDFAPLVYAGEVYAQPARARSLISIADFLGHNLALLAPVLVVGVLVLALRAPGSRRRLWWPGWLAAGAVPAGTRLAQALNIWSIQSLVVIAPVCGALAFAILMKTDWGIPMFFLMPLALLAWPRVRVRRIAPVGALATWLVISLGTLALAPSLARDSFARQAAQGATYAAGAHLAEQLTEMWRLRFGTHWAVAVSFVEAATPMTFYSPDHPSPLGLDTAWGAGLTTLGDARRSGFIGICDTADPRLAACMAWMRDNAAGAERVEVTQRRFLDGVAGPQGLWHVFIVPPAR
jgi:4-amino-4-deoxy-L-arabinose transferase-like glycosyltransferase